MIAGADEPLGELDDRAWLLVVRRPVADQKLLRSPPVELRARAVRGADFTYAACRSEASRVRGLAASALVAPSAGLLDDSAGGQRCAGGSLWENAGIRDGTTLVLFGERPELAGWRCCHHGRPEARLIDLVRTL